MHINIIEELKIEYAENELNFQTTITNLNAEIDEMNKNYNKQKNKYIEADQYRRMAELKI